MFQAHATISRRARPLCKPWLNTRRSFISALPRRQSSRPRRAGYLSSPRSALVVVRPLVSRWLDKGHDLYNSAQRTFSTASVTQSWWKGSSKPAESNPPHSFESEPLDIPEQTEAETEQLPTRRVHILGLGSIGTFLAHSLQCLPNPPPITLLMHRPELYEAFKEKGKTIRLVSPDSEINDEQTGYDVDVLRRDERTGIPYWEYIPSLNGREPRSPLQPGEKLDSGEVYIHTLIVTVKGPRTKHALRSVQHRINAHTTICLMQNGMGQVDELNKNVFTNPATRPTYLLGIISHGAHMSGPFSVNHAGYGVVSLGIHRDTDRYPLPPKSTSFDINQLSEVERKRMYPTEEELYSNLSSRYLLRTLTRSPVLACAPFPHLDLVQLQLEKLVVNCIVNPLTALLNIPNGSMLNNPSVTRAQRLLMAEISLVIRGLPELQGVPGVKARFSTNRLEVLCENQCRKTAKNSSSMREDVRKLKPTEIDYINGYIVRRGEEQGIKCVLNYLLMKLVQAKTEALTGGDIKPYGTSLVEGDMSRTSADPEGAISLEDKGTQLKGKPY